jgi:hypothetical protein
VHTVFSANIHRTPDDVAVGDNHANWTQRVKHGRHILGARGRLHLVQKGGRKLRQHLCRHQEVSRQSHSDEVLRDALLV